MKRYNTFDLIMIAMMAALGLGTKQLVRPLVSLISVPLNIPGGALAGGFYMLWIVIVKRFVPKFGSGTMLGIVQALVVMVLPFGSHGIFTLITYPLPGIIVDIIDLLFGRFSNSLICSATEGAAANLVGTTAVSLIIFNMPLSVLFFILLLALFSGNIGGVIAYAIIKQVKAPLIQEAITEEVLPEEEEEEEELPQKEVIP